MCNLLNLDDFTDLSSSTWPYVHEVVQTLVMTTSYKTPQVNPLRIVRDI